MLSTDTQWFYRKDGRELGPVTWARLRELASAGAVGESDRVRAELSPVWVDAAGVAGLLSTNGEHVSPSLPAGTEVGRQLKVESWESDRLRLRGDRGDNVFLLIGLGCLLVGLGSGALLLAQGAVRELWGHPFNDAPWRVQFARYATLLGVVIPLIIMRSGSGGFDYAFDRKSRTVRRTNFLRLLDHTWPADQFTGVVLDVTPMAQFDTFALCLERREGGQRIRLTYTNADRPEAVAMAVAAGRIGELLSLPVSVIGQERTASAALREELARFNSTAGLVPSPGTPGEG